MHKIYEKNHLDISNTIICKSLPQGKLASY